MISPPFVPPPAFAAEWISGVPVGVVCPYAGQLADPFGSDGEENDSAQPALWLEYWGWMLCDGRQLGIASYPALFEVIGNLYGGDGEYTFRLPDYRGLFLRCVDNGAGVDPDVDQRLSPASGEKYSGVGSVQKDALQDHQHAYQFAKPGDGQEQFQGGQVTSPATPTASGDPILPGSLSPAKPAGDPARTSSETRPRNIYVNYLIKCL
ncbi:phage tail protein [Microbulbifer sp.]|uniref:phage tail protein n=1 Tax=Microbulbifer sp. TaxID=1908541 RepID=UPI003F2C9FE9